MSDPTQLTTEELGDIVTALHFEGLEETLLTWPEAQRYHQELAALLQAEDAVLQAQDALSDAVALAEQRNTELRRAVGIEPPAAPVVVTPEIEQ